MEVMPLISYHILMSSDGETFCVHTQRITQLLCCLSTLPDSAETFEDLGI